MQTDDSEADPSAMTHGLATHTLRLRQNGRHFQTTFTNAFSLMKMFEFLLKFH